MKGTPLLLIASLALGACSLGPDFTRPDRPAPGDWSLQAAAGNPSHLAAAPLAAQWWTLFDDAQLNALLQRVQRANLDLRSAAARLQQSRAIRRSLGGDALPSVDASGNYQRQRTTSAGLFDPSGKAGKGNYNHALAGFDASWELDFWGRVRRELEAADATVEASENELRDVQVSVLAEAARDYIQLRGEQSRAAIIRDNLETARRSLELTRTRLANGVATDLEVAQALAQVASMEARLPEVEKNQAHLVNALGYLVGASPGSLLAELGPAREIPRPPGSVPVGLPSELAQRRPDIRRAEARLHAATASIGVAKADFYPRITLNGNFGFESLQLSSLGDWDHRQFAIGPAFSLPIFEGGRLRGRLELREAQQQEAAIDYQRTVLRAWQEVDDAMHDYAANQRRQERLGEAVAQNRRALQERPRAIPRRRGGLPQRARQPAATAGQPGTAGRQRRSGVADPGQPLQGAGRRLEPNVRPGVGLRRRRARTAKELEMDLLHGIRTFVRVVEHGSFTQAAQALGTLRRPFRARSPGSNRRSRRACCNAIRAGVVVTESGLRYYEHCKQILRTVAAARRTSKTASPTPAVAWRLHAVTRTGSRAPDAATGGLPGRPSGRLRRPHAGPGHPGPARGRPGRADHPRPEPCRTRPWSPAISARCSAWSVPRRNTWHGMACRARRRTCCGIAGLNVAAPSCPQGWAFVGERGETLLDLDEALKVNLPEAACAAAAAGLGVCLLPGFVAARALQEGSLLRLLPGHRLHVREVFVLYSSRRYPGRQDPHLGGFPQGTPAPGVRA
ncbi:putative outer membrane protein [Pseudomonas aeruginosa]|nr:putative outer membrane protein [Pseudomonas aeruginosa]